MLSPFAIRALSFAVAAAMATACGSRPQAPPTFELSGSTMGTRYVVKVVGGGGDVEAERALAELVEAELTHVDELMSTYRAESELSRFNRHADLTPFAVSEATFEVFAEAARISDWTDGAFDITVGPLVEAWGFGASPASAPPSDVQVESLRQRVGFAKLQLDASTRSVRKLDPAVEGDLSAIAKGYAVDRVAEALEAAGFPRFMVEVGGEVRVGGTNDAGAPWRIAIEQPDAVSFQTIVPLVDAAVATSGDYRNFYEWEGGRVSHTIDPRTGRPVEHALASVTVVSGRCVTADALATALSVLGPDDGYRFAVANDVAALMLTRWAGGGFDERSTPAFQRLLDEAGVR